MTDGATLALSVMQPWAWLIVSGAKDVENRTWGTRHRGRVLIHAGKRRDPDFPGWHALPVDAPVPERFDFGGIVGEAELVACVTESASPWFGGPFGFVLRDARPLPFRPCRGALGFFTPDFSARPAPQGALPL